MVLTSEFRLDVEVPETDLPSYIFESMYKYSDRTYMVNSETGHSYTYREALDHCRKIGIALYNNHGIRKGDTILIFSSNCPEYMLLAFGAIAIGAVVTTANPLYTQEELEYHIHNCEPKLVITSPQFAQKVKNAVATYSGVIYDIIVFGNTSGCISYSSLLQNDGKNFPRVKFDPKNDTVFMLYSSGTTGKPKGVEITHSNMISMQRIMISGGIDLLGSKDIAQAKLLVYVPMYHLYGVWMSIMAGCGGHTAIVMPRYELFEFVDVIKRYQVTFAPLVPPTVVQLTKNPQITAAHLNSVHTFLYGAAPVGRDIEKAFRQKFPKQDLRQGYGLTEGGVFTVIPPHSPLRAGSCGKVVPKSEVKFMHVKSGKEVGVDEEGELWVRGPLVMKGYFKNPRATRETIDKDGWAHTGDIGRYDKDGYVYIVDRLKELIKYKANQVAPADLEDLILSHPSVEDCAVVGVPDVEAGELPRAYVVLKPHHSATEKEIVDFVSKHVAPHKRIRGGVKFVDTIPKSSSGKILRRLIRDQIKQEQATKAKL